MPTLIPKPPSSPYIPLLEIIRSKSPDPRIVIYDSVELFSYLRDIDSLNVSKMSKINIKSIPRLPPISPLSLLYHYYCS